MEDRKKENKYYVPDISEFHVGFEYEYYENNVWYKSKFTAGCIRKDDNRIQPEIERKTRVKYLDISDIEELGWKFLDKKNDFGENLYEFKIEEEFNNFTIWTLAYRQHKVILSYKTKTSWANQSFDGLEFTIKNKSELAKLMKQLNIVE